jgi:type VI secretion system secreted protein Hcp
MIIKKYWIAGGVALTSAALFGASVALGQATPAPINACVNVAGLLRIVGAAGRCVPGETPLQWNQQGPAGPAGPAGASGSGASAASPLDCTPSIEATGGLDIFAKLDGITGGSVDAAHRGEIDASAFGWGGILTAVSAGAGTGASRPKVGPVCLLKSVDRASTAIVDRAIRGTRVRQAEITFRRSNAAGRGAEFFTMTLEDVTVSAYEPGRFGSAVGEKVTLSFARATIEQCPLRADGSLDACNTVVVDSRGTL